MKLKNKIISIVLTLFMVISSFTYSSASALVAGGVISYELLMGLMGVGVAFGLSLPKDDNEYWDYTRSLKNHLHLVDDKYLELLKKSSEEWHSNNHNKPDNDKEPFKVPFDVAVFSKLFDSVGKDVSVEKEYVIDALSSIPVCSSPLEPGILINGNMNISYINSTGTSTMIDFSISPDPQWSHISKLNYTISSGDSVYSGSTSYNNSFNIDFKFIKNSEGIYPAVANVDIGSYIVNFANRPSKELGYKSFDKNLDTYKSNPLEYNKIEQSGELELPNLPSVSVPNPSTSPEFGYGGNPLTSTDPLYSNNSNPGGDTEGDTGGDTEGDTGTEPGLMQSIINLVVPSSDYWQNTFNNFFDNVGNAFPMLDVGRFKDLCINGVAPKDIDVTIMGSTGTIFNTKYLNSIVDWLQPIVSAFMAFLLMLYNYRKVYKLIRGYEPFSGIADGNSVGEVRGKMDGAMPEMGGSSFVGPSTAGTWSDGQSVTRGSIQSKYYGRDL